MLRIRRVRFLGLRGGCFKMGQRGELRAAVERGIRWKAEYSGTGGDCE